MNCKRVLLACTNYWNSPFQVGSHHLARAFARLGWDVAYISEPISPLHFCARWTEHLRKRWASWCRGGSQQDGVWSYVPAALLTPHNQPLLRSGIVHQGWQRWTVPNVVAAVRRRGFGSPDLLYIDSPYQSFWLDALSCRQAVYRLADYNPQFRKYTAAARCLEEAAARRTDLVLCPSRALRRYADELGARRTLLLPNGVDYEHFARPQPPPPEYAAIRSPRAVYMGVIPERSHFDWVARAARELPNVSFVLIGPDRLARTRLRRMANVHILGLRDHAKLPAYLQHAQLGLMPFDATRDRTGVDALNLQKLYAYFASGIPVVSTDWEELRNLDCPVRRAPTAEAFVSAICAALADPGSPAAHRSLAAGHNWCLRLTDLLDALATLPAVWSATG